MDRRNITKYIYDCEDKLKEEFKKYEHISFFNSMKVLNAFHENRVNESHLNGTTGYGYNDDGRDVVERVYADVFKCEDALVRTYFWYTWTYSSDVCLFKTWRYNACY